MMHKISYQLDGEKQTIEAETSQKYFRDKDGKIALSLAIIWVTGSLGFRYPDGEREGYDNLLEAGLVAHTPLGTIKDIRI